MNMTRHVTKDLNSITITIASKLLFKETKLLIYLELENLKKKTGSKQKILHKTGKY